MNEKHDMELDSLTRGLESLRRGRLSTDVRERIWGEAWKRSEEHRAESSQRREFFASLRMPKLRTSLRTSTLRLAVAVQCVLILCLGTVGLLYAANQSAPGEALYPAKRQTEAVWLKIAPEHKQTEIELVLLGRRVEEIQQLTLENQPVPETLHEEVYQAFFDIAKHPEKWEKAEALPEIEMQVETLAALSATYPGTEIDETVRASVNAFEQLGGSVSTLSMPSHLVPTPTSTSTPTALPTATQTPLPVPTAIPTASPPADQHDLDPGQEEESPGQSGDAPGQSDDPPGQGDEPPGQGNEPPGQGDEPPGQGDEPPGQGDEPPGQGDDPPGQGNEPPGQGNEPPGQGDEPPGQGDEPPGQGDEPPGQGDDPPGQGNEPPGQGNEPPGQGDEPPGQGDEPPGQGNPPGKDK